MRAHIQKKLRHRFFFPLRKSTIILLLQEIARRRATVIMGKSLPRKITTFYSNNPDNELVNLFQKHGSDKGASRLSGLPYPWPPHTYADLYDSMWSKMRKEIRNVFECGIGTNSYSFSANMGPNGIPGASLRAWRDYFVNAQVYGADIDRGTLFSENRISTHWVDQLSQDSIRSLWDEIGNVKFDIILDDGLHSFVAGSTFFVGSINSLAENGVYVIEDVSNSNLLKYMNFFKNRSYIVEYHMFQAEYQNYDNNLILIRKK
jgi:hypothetical protein